MKHDMFILVTSCSFYRPDNSNRPFKFSRGKE